jgi:hypothetical protein
MALTLEAGGAVERGRPHVAKVIMSRNAVLLAAVAAAILIVV